jgi:WD40 repeat protein
VAFSPTDDKIVLTGGLDDTGWLWNRNTGESLKVRLYPHEGQVRALAYSPDGKTILTGSQDKKARLWLQRRVSVSEIPSNITGRVSRRPEADRR